MMGVPMDPHKCHAIGCKVTCSPKLLMCANHWRMLPPELRFPVIRNYRRGQSDDKKPSADWLKAAKTAIAFVEVEERRRRLASRVASGLNRHVAPPKVEG
jgi:hypothetical protein